MTPFRLIIDSFAGGGGASTGIEAALGRSPDVAINHNAAALALHAANHPETLHLDSNIWDVAPREVTGGRPVGLLWASPDCKHFSKAKGGAPRDRNIRDLAWVVVRWAEEVKPDVILMENVEEFLTWGPVGEDGQPIREFAGMTFDLWVKRLRKAGYRVQWRELRACDFGAPTIRKRFFMVARRDGRPIVWPRPTHGDPTSVAVRKGRLAPWRTAAECIDWSLPCPSIFDSAPDIMAQHGLRAVRPLKPNTLARVARGLHRYVLTAERPFIVQTTGHTGYSGAEPAATVTTGGHHAMVAPSITRFNGGATGQNLRDPLATVTANSWIKKPGGAAPLGLIAPHLMTMRNSAKPFNGADQPTHTVTAGGAGLTLVAPVLTYAQQGGANRAADAPHHTICASRKDQNSLIAATMVQTGYGEAPGQMPRALDVTAPLGTVVAGGGKHAPVAAFLARHFSRSIGHEADAPHGTITAGGDGKTSPVAAFLAQANNDSRRAGGVNPGRSADAPLSTICQTGSHQNLTTAWLAKWFKTPQDPRLEEPMHTVTTKPRFDVEQATLAAPPFSPEHHAKARQVAALLRDHGIWDDREFVTLTIDGAEFVIVDVGMRMLTPRELFRAQGFPDDYVIEGVWEGAETDAPVWRPFPKDVQVSCCGNSVCPPLAEALVRANCWHLITADVAAWPTSGAVLPRAREHGER
jgi:DNA (cytosine-5)-methyltransferase 1